MKYLILHGALLCCWLVGACSTINTSEENAILAFRGRLFHDGLTTIYGWSGGRLDSQETVIDIETIPVLCESNTVSIRTQPSGSIDANCSKLSLDLQTLSANLFGGIDSYVTIALVPEFDAVRSSNTFSLAEDGLRIELLHTQREISYTDIIRLIAHEGFHVVGYDSQPRFGAEYRMEWEIAAELHEYCGLLETNGEFDTVVLRANDVRINLGGTISHQSIEWDPNISIGDTIVYADIFARHIMYRLSQTQQPDQLLDLCATLRTDLLELRNWGVGNFEFTPWDPVTDAAVKQ